MTMGGLRASGQGGQSVNLPVTPDTDYDVVTLPVTPDTKKDVVNLPAQEIAQQQQIAVKSATTGKDKYIVDNKGRQQIMTGQEILRRGGYLPDRYRIESEIHQAVLRGENYEIATERIAGEAAAKEKGMTGKELTSRIKGKNREEQLQDYADKYGLSLNSAAKLIKEYNDNPDSAKFKSLNRWERRDLAEFEGAKDYIASTTENIAWQKLNAANKKNPDILKTVYINRKQHNVLDIEAAYKAGVTAETLNLIGQEQRNSPVPTIIKEDKGDIGTLFTNGWSGFTKNNMDDIVQAAVKRGEAKRLTAEYEKEVQDFEKYIRASDTPQELKDAYKKGGIAGYNQAVKVYNEKVEAENKRNAFIYESELLDVEHASDKQKAALGKLDKYKAGNDGYYIQQYWRDTGDIQTLKDAGFDLDALSPKLKDDIKYYTETVPTAKGLREQKAKEQEVKENLYQAGNRQLPVMPLVTDKETPAKKYSEVIPDKSYEAMEAQLVKAGLPKEMAGLAVVALTGTAASPIPGDELAVALALLGIAATATAAKGIKDYIDKNKKTPEVYVTDSTGNVARASGYVMDIPKEGLIPQFIPPQVNKKALTDLVPPEINIRPIENIPVTIQNKTIENIPVNLRDSRTGLLIFKQVKPEDIDAEYGLLTAQTVAAVAEKKLAAKTDAILDTLKKADSKDPDIDRLIKARDSYESSARVIRELHRKNSLGNAPPWIIDQYMYKDFTLAYKDYLYKKELLDAARHSYVASLDPQPVKGKVSKEAIDKAAALYLSSKLKLSKVKAGESLQTYLQRITGIKISTKLMQAIQTGTKTQQLEAVKTLIKPSRVAQGTRVKTGVEAKTQATQTATKTTTATRTGPAFRTAEATRTAEMTKPAELIKPIEAVTPTTLTGKGKLKLPGIGTDEKKKDWTPEDVKSAIAWKDGFVVHAIKSPYRRGIDEKSYNVDNLPKGMIVMQNYKGQGSQSRSAKVTGKFPGKLTVDVGNQDVVITQNKGRVKLSHSLDRVGTSSRLTVKRQRGRSINGIPGILTRKNQTRQPGVYRGR